MEFLWSLPSYHGWLSVCVDIRPAAMHCNRFWCRDTVHSQYSAAVSSNQLVFGFVLQCKENAQISIKQNDFNRNIKVHFVLPFNFSSSHHHCYMRVFVFAQLKMYVFKYQCTIACVVGSNINSVHILSELNTLTLSRFIPWKSIDTKHTHICLAKVSIVCQQK